jgi:hypothetical protein
MFHLCFEKVPGAAKISSRAFDKTKIALNNHLCFERFPRAGKNPCGGFSQNYNCIK